MKKQTAWLMIAGLIFLGLTSITLTVHAGDATEEGKWKAKPWRQYERADQNRDGVVDDAEKAKAEEIKARWKEKTDQIDTNDDGKVDREEKKAALKDRADINDDGKVSRREKRVIHEKMEHKVDRKMDRRLDRDNNPPGRRGGPGTNWENPKGPKGGPGASPNRKGKKRAN